MRQVFGGRLGAALLAVAGLAFFHAQPTYAQDATIDVFAVANSSSTCGFTASGDAAIPFVNREGITEKAADVGMEGEPWAKNQTVQLTFSDGVDLTDPVVANGGVLPAANVVVCDPTLAISQPVVTRAITALGVQVTITFNVTTAATNFEPNVVFRNLRWDMTKLADGTFFKLVSGFFCSVPGVGCTLNTPVGTGDDESVSGGKAFDLALAKNTILGSRVCDLASLNESPPGAECFNEELGTNWGFGLQNANGGLIENTSVEFAENFTGALPGAHGPNNINSNGDRATSAADVEFNIFNVPPGVTVTMPSQFLVDPLDSALLLGSPTGTCSAVGSGPGSTIDCTYQVVNPDSDADDSAFAFFNGTQINTGATAGPNTIVVNIGASSGIGTAAVLATFGPDSTSAAVPRYVGNPITFFKGIPVGWGHTGPRSVGCSSGGDDCVLGSGLEGRGIVFDGFFTILPTLTDILVPWVTDRPTGWDTGIAVSNTGLDNFGCPGASMGCAPTLANSAAFGTTGPVTVTLFPDDGSAPVVFTTGPGKTPGFGLQANGTLAPGQTWSIALSTLLAAAGVTTPKAGYMLIQTGFLYGHAAVFDFTPSFGFATTPTIVLPFQLARPVPIPFQEPQGQIAGRKH